MATLTRTNLDNSLKFLSGGKVRDIYEIDDSKLLFVATDRISAYDVIMENGIPSKGKILTALSEFWFNLLSSVCPNHLITSSLEGVLPDAVVPYVDQQLKGRSMVVKKLKVFKLEAIVRGYISGSAWSEYQKNGTVCGMKMPDGMKESQSFERPIFTPSTKAEQGEHDENIHPDEARRLIGEKYDQIEQLAITLYTKARDYAYEHGIIIADTKFEFGLDEEKDEIVLVDEVLTPDSSRFWPKDRYEIGRAQESYDKQFLRDWLTKEGLKGKTGVSMPDDIVRQTKEKYVEAFELITRRKWQE